MRIGLDYLLATTHAPGLGRYSRELVRAHFALREAPELALFEWGAMRRSQPVASLGLPAGVGVHRVRLPGRLQGFASRVGWNLRRQLGPLDLFHRVRPDLPALGDLPFTFPIVRLPGPGTPAHTSLGTLAQQALGVFVFCQDYAQRVETEWGLPAERIAQVPVGCEHWAREARIQNLALDGPRNGIVVLGASRAARRAATLIEGWRRYQAQGGREALRWLGHRDPRCQATEAAWAAVAGEAAQCFVPHEADMPRRMAESKTLVHLAEDEGSPVTPLEAARMGLHVVLESIPAFQEAFPPEGPVEPLWLPRNPTPEDIADALAICDQRTPPRALDLPGFTWGDCAQAHVDAWRAWAPHTSSA